MMELQGEDGSIVAISETLKKELGRGPGIAIHDRSVSRRQACLQVQRIADPCVAVEVVGANPICVLHASVGDVEVEIVKSGTQSLLKVGDKFSLSIQEPFFYTLRRPNLLGHGRNDSGKLHEDDQRVTADEEEGIAEAVARWQRRKQERLQPDQRWTSALEGSAQQTLDLTQQGLVYNQAVSREAKDPEQTEWPTTNEDGIAVAKKFGFVLEGSEFERYGKKGLDSSRWDWQIGRQPVSDGDDDEGSIRGGRQQQNRTAPGPRTKQKVKSRNEDDDDDWRGDSEGEKELLSARKRSLPRKKDVHTRARDVVKNPKMKRNFVSTSDTESPSSVQVKAILSKQGTTSTSTRKMSSRQPGASKNEEDDEDDDEDGEDLDGFLVDDVDEEDDEVADEEDEWTDEDEELEDDEKIGEDSPDRPVMDKADGADDKPLCQYGSRCFRKNKDHLAQFRH